MTVKIQIDPSDVEALKNINNRLSHILTFLERIHEFMGTVGLRMYEHFQIEISRWIDEEVEGWNYLQIKVTLLGSGMSEISERGVDKFVLLKSLISMATQILPQELRQEVVVLVE